MGLEKTLFVASVRKAVLGVSTALVALIAIAPLSASAAPAPPRTDELPRVPARVAIVPPPGASIQPLNEALRGSETKAASVIDDSVTRIASPDTNQAALGGCLKSGYAGGVERWLRAALNSQTADLDKLDATAYNACLQKAFPGAAAGSIEMVLNNIVGRTDEVATDAIETAAATPTDSATTDAGSGGDFGGGGTGQESSLLLWVLAGGVLVVAGGLIRHQKQV